MTDRIELRGLRLRGNHGVYDYERAQGQEFVVDVVLEVDTAPAALHDNIVDTVDYGELAQVIGRIVTGAPVNLIETLADRIATACLVDERVEAVEITVHKPDAPIPLQFDDVVVTIRRTQGRR